MTRAGWLARRLVVREIVARPLRYGLSAFAVALGVALFVSTETSTGAIESAVSGVRDSLDAGVDLVVSRDAGGIDDDALEALRARPEFASVAGTIEIAASLPTGGRLRLIGMDPRASTQFHAGERGFKLAEVDATTALLRVDAIVVSRGFARALALSVGSTLALDTSLGTKSFVVAGLFDVPPGLEDAVAGIAFVSLASAQILFQRDGLVDRAQCVLAPGVSRDAAEAAVTATLGPLATAASPSEWTRSMTVGLDTFRAVFFLNDLLALLIAAFFVFNAVAAVLAERTREAGLLRATGMSRRGLLGVILGEAAVLAIAGGALGIALGTGLALVTSGMMADVVSRIHFTVPPLTERFPSATVIAEALVLAFVTTAVATIVAAWPLLRREPLELLRAAEAGERRARATWRAAAVAGAIAVVALMYGSFAERGHERGAGTIAVVALALTALFAMPAIVMRGGAWLRGRLFARHPTWALALDATTLHPTRTTMTIGAFALGLALVVTHGGVTRGMGDSIRGWLEGNIPSDVLIGGLAFPFNPDGAGDFASIDGVDRVFHFRYRRARAPGAEIALAALDFDIARDRSRIQFVSGEPQRAFDDVIATEAVFVSENFAWKQNRAVGDTVELATPDGSRTFRIAAIVRDYTQPGGTVLMHLPRYRALFRDPTVDFIELCLKPGVDAHAVAALARARRSPDHAFLEVAEKQDYLDHVVGFVDDLRALSFVQLALALCIGAFAIFTTVTLSVLSRRRELALLRALGMDPKAWRASVACEVAILSCAAAVAGLALGHVLWIPANDVFRSFSGFVFDHAWPWRETVFAACGAFVVAWIAMRMPLRLMRDLDFRESEQS